LRFVQGNSGIDGCPYSLFTPLSRNVLVFVGLLLLFIPSIGVKGDLGFRVFGFEIDVEQ